MIARPVPKGAISSARNEASLRWRGAATDAMIRQAAAPAEAPPSSQNARKTLKNAQLALSTAEAEHAEASTATARARSMEEKAAEKIAKLAEINRRIASARAAEIKVAARANRVATFRADGEVSANAVAMAEAENQRTAARFAADDLQAEQDAANAAVMRARAAVEDAIAGIVKAEAVAIAQRAASLAAAAMAERIKLGSMHGYIDHLSIGDDDVIRGIRANMELEHNSKEECAARVSSEIWLRFAAALATDAEARLDFDL